MKDDFIMDFRTDGQCIIALRFSERGWMKVGRPISLSEVEDIIGAFRKIEELGLGPMETPYEDETATGQEISSGAIPINIPIGGLTDVVKDIVCPNCSSSNIRKNGRRMAKNTEEKIQRYNCKDCDHTFSESRPNKKYPSIDTPDEVVDEAVRFYNSSSKKSFRKTAEYLQEKFNITISYATIAYWHTKHDIGFDVSKNIGRPKTLTDEDEERIKTLVKKEMKYEDIIDIFEVDGIKVLSTQISRIVADAGIEVKKGGHADYGCVKSDEEIEKVIEELIDEKVNVTPKNVYRRLGFKGSPNPTTGTGKKIHELCKKYEGLEKIVKTSTGRPPIDPKIVARGLELVDKGWTERKVAEKLKEEFNLKKLAFSTVNNWKKKRKEPVAPVVIEENPHESEQTPTKIELVKKREKSGARPSVDWGLFRKEVNTAIDTLIEGEKHINIRQIGIALNLSYVLSGKRRDFVNKIIIERGIMVTRGQVGPEKKKAIVTNHEQKKPSKSAVIEKDMPPAVRKKFSNTSNKVDIIMSVFKSGETLKGREIVSRVEDLGYRVDESEIKMFIYYTMENQYLEKERKHGVNHYTPIVGGFRKPDKSLSGMADDRVSVGYVRKDSDGNILCPDKNGEKVPVDGSCFNIGGIEHCTCTHFLFIKGRDVRCREAE